MVMSLAACGSDSDDDKKDKDKDKDEVVETVENKDDKDDKDEDDKDDLSQGASGGNVYENEYFGITFTKPSSWKFNTYEEIAATMGTAYPELEDPEDFRDFLDACGSVYDMMATDASTGSNVMILYEDLSVNNATAISVDDYLDKVVQDLEATGMGYELAGDYELVQLGDTVYSKAVLTVNMNGIEFEQVYYVSKSGKYICGVIATCFGGVTPNDIEAMFS